MNARVSIQRCPDYGDVKAAIKQSLDLIGGLEGIISSGDRVMLKANILAAYPPEDAVTTHPAVVKAMCELVAEVGGVPVVGDCAGITHSGATEKALEVSGIKAAARECGADVINFETAGFVEVEVPDGRQFFSLFVSKPLLEADVIISLPKLKTHELTFYTGGVKNMFGAVPLKTRKEAHLLGKRDLFGQAVIDIYSVVKPDLCVMDGVVGMEGNGPSHGTPVRSGMVLASYDCVSLDIVASRLIGFDPFAIPTTSAAVERGLGEPEPDILGVPLEDVKMGFKPSVGGLTGCAPAFLTRRLGKLFTIKPFINQSRCTLCGACVRNCSPAAIEMFDSQLAINDSKCIMCYCCRELCPSNAVEMKKSLLAKMLTGC